MPVHIDIGDGQFEYPDRNDIDYTYEYLNGLDLSPTSDLHKKLLNFVHDRAHDSYNVISSRHNAWIEVDRTLTAFVPPASTEEDTTEAGNETKKTHREIIVPVSYTIYETLLAQLAANLLNDPIIRYNPAEPSDTVGVALLEIYINSQIRRRKMALDFYIMLSDSIKYGIGVIGVQWIVKRGSVVKKTETPHGTVRTLSEDVVYEGNDTFTIDPYNFLPDPNVPLHRIQDSEFIGWIERTNVISLLSRENLGDFGYFNAEYIRANNKTSCVSDLYTDNYGERSGVSRKDASRTTSRPVDLTHMFINVIPSDLGISDSNKPEKWKVTIAGDRYVVQLYRVDDPHGMFPISVCAPEMDGHSIYPISKIELNWGLQNYIDFLYSSREANVKKSVNDMFVVDPSLINMKDFYNPGPGKAIRLRKQAWKRGVADAIQQFPVSDVTRQHVLDASAVIELLFQTSAPHTLQGNIRDKGERRSATEARTAQLGAMTKIDRSVMVASVMAFNDIGHMMAANAQWYSTEEQTIRVTGRWEQDLKREYGVLENIRVKPSDLVVNYDVLVHDGTIIGGDQAQTWVQLLQVIMQYPGLAQQFDVVRLVLHISKMMGARNVEDFMIKPNQEPVQYPEPSSPANQRPSQNGTVL